MATIDSDAHVVETEKTWDYIPESDAKYRPGIVAVEDGPSPGTRYWFIDGKVRSRVRVTGAKGLAANVSRRMDVPAEAREMEDIDRRLAHMDELGIDVQVLYPTLYINPMCDRFETEVVLSRSYNRWLADIWEKGGGRLRWACIVPLSVMDEAIAELRWAKEHGACAVNMRGLEGQRLLCDPYFFPLYEEAERLQLAIGCHIGNSNPDFGDIFASDPAGGTFGRFRLVTVASFHAMITSGVPEMFPKLNFVFVEAAAMWIPYVMHDLVRRFETRGKKLDPDVMAKYRLFVTCQTDDDIPYVLKYAGEDNLLAGTDYGHQDQSSEIEALRLMRTRGDLPSHAVDKILYDNPKRAYYLEV